MYCPSSLLAFWTPVSTIRIQSLETVSYIMMSITVGMDMRRMYHPHGTATAGIVADLTMENVLVKPYKVLGYKGTGYESGICAGRLAAIDADVDVINMSREDIVSNLNNHATDMGEKYLTLSMVMDC